MAMAVENDLLMYMYTQVRREVTGQIPVAQTAGRAFWFWIQGNFQENFACGAFFNYINLITDKNTSTTLLYVFIFEALNLSFPGPKSAPTVLCIHVVFCGM